MTKSLYPTTMEAPTYTAGSCQMTEVPAGETRAGRDAGTRRQKLAYMLMQGCSATHARICRRSRVRWDWAQGGQDERQAWGRPVARWPEPLHLPARRQRRRWAALRPMTGIPAGRAPVPGSGQPPRHGSHRRLRAHLSAWTGRCIGLLLCAAVVRVESAPWGQISSSVFPVVTGRPATGLCLASGCAAGLPARGAIG